MGPQTATFPQLLARLAAERPDGTALQEKRYGIWQPLSWSGYATRVNDFAHGLAALGIRRGDIVAVLGDNRPEWLIAELAAQSLGAAVVGIYPTSIGEELMHVLSLARVRVVVAEDQEQVDKLIRLRVPFGDAAIAVLTHSGAGPPLLVDTVVYYDPSRLGAVRRGLPRRVRRRRGPRPRVGGRAPRLARRAAGCGESGRRRAHLHHVRDDLTP